MVEGGGFEPPKLARQIYSLIPLATREPLRKAAYCPDGPRSCQPLILIKLLTYNLPSPQTPRGQPTRQNRLYFDQIPDCRFDLHTASKSRPYMYIKTTHLSANAGAPLGI